MTFIDHLTELRSTFIKCICAIFICAIPAGIYWESLFQFIAVTPLSRTDILPRIIYTAPAEVVMLSIKITIFFGVILASPLVFWFLWRFIAPGLYKKEKVVILPVVIASSVCFVGGFVFCYYLLPYVLRFLLAFANVQIEPYYKVDDYLDFLLRMSLAFGLAFELPVVTFVLAKLGVINHRILLKYFSYIIVAIFVLSAIITPPDVFSQIVVSVPLIGLYALSILIAYILR